MSLCQNNSKLRWVLCLPSGSIGDALMLLALCAEIIERDAQVRVTIVARRNGQLIQDLAKAYPRIRVIVIRKNMMGALTLVGASLRHSYTTLVPVPNTAGSFFNTRLLFYMLSLLPGSATFGLIKKEREPNPYRVALAYEQNELYIDNLRRLAQAAQLQTAPKNAPVHLKLAASMPRDNRYAAGPYLVFHPFGSNAAKSFPPHRCVALLQTITKQYSHLAVLVTGSKENEQEAEDIVAQVPRAHSVTGLPILEVAGLIQHAALYVGVDTGITHLAGVLQKESVVLGHGNTPTWLPSYNPRARILVAASGHTHDLPDSEIAAAIGSFLHAKK